MGATLRYAKIVDRDHLQEHGGLSPSTDNLVVLATPPPAVAHDFVVLRAWDDVDGGVVERWHVEDAHGRTHYEGVPRTVRANDGDVSDEVQGARFPHDGDDYQLVLAIDDREVARVDFTVAVSETQTIADPATSPATTTAPELTDAASPAAGDAAGASADDDASTSDAGDDPVIRDLSATEQRVFAAAAAVEADREPGFAHDIAERAEVSLEEAREALSRLASPHDLVQELSSGTGDAPDLGPRYRVKARP